MMIHIRRSLTAILVLTCLSLVSCRKDVPDLGWVDEEVFSMGSYLENESYGYQFTRFLALVEITNNLDAMKASNPEGTGYTCFLPNDIAFEHFLERSAKYNSFEDLVEDTAYCMDLVRYHIVNTQSRLSELPLGGLPDRTISGDFLTIAFRITEDSSIYLVNGRAEIIEPDIEVINGIMHVINQVLVPVQTGSYEWLATHPETRIFSELLEYTGIYEQLDKGDYTLLVEQDSIYHKAGIYSFDDLRNSLDDPSLEPDNPENGLYKFAAYHVLKNIYFLDQFKSGNYPTLTSSPVNIKTGLEILINRGVDTFDIQISGSDTIVKDWINPFILESNFSTKRGTIHFIDQVLEYYVPGSSAAAFHFYDRSNPYPLDKYHGESLERRFIDPEDFAFIDWTSSDGELWYVLDTDLGGQAVNNDYIKLEGNFRIDYEIGSVLIPGDYELILAAKTGTNENFAMVEVLVDGLKVGDNINLATESSRGGNPYDRISIGTVTIESYSNHIVTVQSLVSGMFIWDFIRFEPR
jgi:uncharacterized surface protein with fasciclin (FAS1) repeats